MSYFCALMGKIKKILSEISDKHRLIIIWTAVFLFFFLPLLNHGIGFAILHATYITGTMMIVSLVENRVFIRYILNKGKHVLYYLANVVFICGISMLMMMLEIEVIDLMQVYMSVTVKPVASEGMVMPFFFRVLTFTVVASVSAITYLMKNDKETQRIANELKIENLDMELRYLKSQINPHFLFNALNNIYSLVYTHDEGAPQSILKLSEMLRYVMVDCQSDTISLEKEMKFIDNYIDFQRLKLEDKRNVQFDKDVKNWNYQMPPMIFQPIVENAFKYSRIENDPNGFIRFSLRQDENSLEFVAENSIKNSSTMLVSTKQKTSTGIGLNNVKKRLSLHYKEKFSFKTEEENNIYKVVIKIMN